MKLRVLMKLSLAMAAVAGLSLWSFAAPLENREGPGAGRMREVLESLTPQERQQYRVAHKTAIKDPAANEARQAQEDAQKEFMSARNNALLQQDPSLAPVIDKIEAARSNPTVEPTVSASATAPATASGARWLRRETLGGAINHLSPEEIQRLHAAEKAIRKEPAVQQARTRLENATKEFRGAVRAAMLKADPAIGPVLDKVEAAMTMRQVPTDGSRRNRE